MLQRLCRLFVRQVLDWQLLILNFLLELYIYTLSTVSSSPLYGRAAVFVVHPPAVDAGAVSREGTLVNGKAAVNAVQAATEVSGAVFEKSAACQGWAAVFVVHTAAVEIGSVVREGATCHGWGAIVDIVHTAAAEYEE